MANNYADIPVYQDGGVNDHNPLVFYDAEAINLAGRSTGVAPVPGEPDYAAAHRYVCRVQNNPQDTKTRADWIQVTFNFNWTWIRGDAPNAYLYVANISCYYGDGFTWDILNSNITTKKLSSITEGASASWRKLYVHPDLWANWCTQNYPLAVRESDQHNPYLVTILTTEAGAGQKPYFKIWYANYPASFTGSHPNKTTKGIQLEWSSAPVGTDEYAVGYTIKTSGGALVDTLNIAATSKTLNQTNGTSVAYRIYGRYTSNQKTNHLSSGYRSATVKVKITPQNPKVVARNKNATVSWTAVPDSANCSKYEVAYSSDQQNWSIKTVNGGASNSTTIGSAGAWLSAGTWYFKVRAYYNIIGEYSAYSSVVSGVVTDATGTVGVAKIDDELFEAFGGENPPTAKSFAPTLYFEVDDPGEVGLKITEYKITDDSTEGVLYSAIGVSETSISLPLDNDSPPYWWGPGGGALYSISLWIKDNYGNESNNPELKFYGYNRTPSAPALKTPVHQSVLLSYLVGFSWTFSDPDGDDYDDFQSGAYVEISKGVYNNIVNSYLGLGASPSVPNVEGNNEYLNGVNFDVEDCGEGTYFFRVKTFDQCGKTSGWSGYREFKVNINKKPNPPTLTTPASNALIFNQRGTEFQWTFSDPDTGYGDKQTASEWKLYGNPAPVEDEQPLQSILLTSEAEGLNRATYDFYGRIIGTYYWTARTKDNRGEWGDEAPRRSLRWNGMNTAPYAPTLVSPPNNQEYYLFPEGTNVTFVWTFEDKDKGAPVHDSQSQALVEINGEFLERPHTINPSTQQGVEYLFTSEGLYSWRVKCWDSYNGEGAWSSPRALILTADVLTPVPISPINGASVRLGTPLKWNYMTRFPDDFQSGYHVRVYNSSGTIIWERDTGAEDIHSNAKETCLPRDLLVKGNTYSWDVAAYGAPYDASEKSAFSAKKIFSVVNDTTYLIGINNLVHVSSFNPDNNFSAAATSLILTEILGGNPYYFELLFDVSSQELADLELSESSKILDHDGYTKLVFCSESASGDSYTLDIRKLVSSWSRASVTWGNKPSNTSLSITYDIENTSVATNPAESIIYHNGLIPIPADGLAGTLESWIKDGDNYGLTIVPYGDDLGMLSLRQSPPTIDSESMEHYLVLHVDIPPTTELISPNGSEELPEEIPGNSRYYQFMWNTTPAPGDYQDAVYIWIQAYQDEQWVNDSTVRGGGEFLAVVSGGAFSLSHLNDTGTFQFPENKNYRWKVKPRNQHGTYGEYQEEWGYFCTRGSSAPEPPEITYPTNGSIVHSKTPTIAWNFVDPDPGSYQSAFILEIYDNDTDQKIYDSEWVQDPNPYFSIPQIAGLVWDRDYRVQVMVADDEGAMSPWGPPNSFVASQSAFWGQCSWTGGSGQSLWSKTDRFLSGENVVYNDGRISLVPGQGEGYLLSSVKRRADLSKAIVPVWDIDGDGTEVIRVWVRGGNVATPDGTWTDWAELFSGKTISSVIGNKIYIQYKIEITEEG